MRFQKDSTVDRENFAVKIILRLRPTVKIGDDKRISMRAYVHTSRRTCKCPIEDYSWQPVLQPPLLSSCDTQQRGV